VSREDMGVEDKEEAAVKVNEATEDATEEATEEATDEAVEEKSSGEAEGDLVTVMQQVLPTTADLQEMGPELREVRNRYWWTVLLCTYLATVMVGTLVMKQVLPCTYLRNGVAHVYDGLPAGPRPLAGHDHDEPTTTSLWQDTTRVLIIVIFTPYYVLVVGLSAWSASTKRLSNTTGLDWEIYWVVMTFLSALLLTQSVLAVVFRAGPDHRYSSDI